MTWTAVLQPFWLSSLPHVSTGTRNNPITQLINNNVFALNVHTKQIIFMEIHHLIYQVTCKCLSTSSVAFESLTLTSTESSIESCSSKLISKLATNMSASLCTGTVSRRTLVLPPVFCFYKYNFINKRKDKPGISYTQSTCQKSHILQHKYLEEKIH